MRIVINARRLVNWNFLRHGLLVQESKRSVLLRLLGLWGSPGVIKPEHLEDKAWSHRPLVFLNACGSLGYSPDALSPFLKTLVEGREASGVLGTEVPVAEILAGQVACAFMTKFLKEGKQAGQALLEVRQALLAKFNPLGLVYTLFAPAELVVDLYGNCE